MKTCTLYVNSIFQHRGNQHGYTSSDYARDVAQEINRSMGNSGESSWEFGDNNREYFARRTAEAEIAKCDPAFRDLLVIEIIESDNEEN